MIVWVWTCGCVVLYLKEHTVKMKTKQCLKFKHTNLLMLYVKPTNATSDVNLMWVGWVRVCGVVFAVMMVCFYEAIRMIRVGEILSEIMLFKKTKTGVPVFRIPVL